MGGFGGKVVLITGASSGIGEALAREFAREGASLVLAARREDRLRALADDLSKTGTRSVVVACDVTRDGDVDKAVAAGREAFSRIDVAIANAGFGVAGRFERLALDDYRRQFETNVFGVLRTAWAALPSLKETRGALVLVSSVAGYIAAPATSAYSMSKFAVRAFAKAVSAELEPAGVAVVLVNPGFVDSEIRKVDNQGRLHPDAKDSVPAWLRVPAPAAARQIVRAVACRRREAVITGHGKLLVAAERLIPGMMAWAVRRTGAKRKDPGRNASSGSRY
ncbi:MAG: SDR family oxidoreductase [Deltaproteobacteria bacterium]|nr:SDR family oxidoreductase [Deltaproteobacteria bacterium]